MLRGEGDTTKCDTLGLGEARLYTSGCLLGPFHVEDPQIDICICAAPSGKGLFEMIHISIESIKDSKCTS